MPNVDITVLCPKGKKNITPCGISAKIIPFPLSKTAEQRSLDAWDQYHAAMMAWHDSPSPYLKNIANIAYQRFLSYFGN